MRSTRPLLAAATLAVLCVQAHADVYPAESQITIDREKAGGAGTGKVHGEYAFTRDKASKDQAIKEISRLTLPPGASISYHKHLTNEDTYIVVSGQGIFKDKDGQDRPVKAGDVTIVRKGESHGIANNGSEPLVLIDVIAEQ